MFPNLIEATNQYWQQLNELEAAYQQGDVSIEEVDARVAELMTELGNHRRAALRSLWESGRRFWQEQTELILGGALLGGLSYAWIVLR